MTDAPARPPRVTLIGPVNVDLFIRGQAPIDRDTLNGWVGPSDVDLVVAGSIGYTAQAFARLGDLVELHTAVGDDAFGAFIREALAAQGIDGRFVAGAEGLTAIAIYMLLFGGHKRPMTYRLPGFEPWPDPLAVVRPGEPPPDLVHSGGLLHFPQMWHRGLAAAFRTARGVGAMTAIDPQFPLVATPAPWLDHVGDALAEADVLLCDEGELGMLFDAADTAAGVRAAHAAGPRIVVVKRAARGSLVSDGEGVLEQPAVALTKEQVREAVGAGDAFDAGFLDMLVRGASPAEAACFGTAAAALTLSGRGGAEAIASRGSVESMLERVPSASPWFGD
jgi:sugar/nucleoside kinase (ribokinase family)